MNSKLRACYSEEQLFFKMWVSKAYRTLVQVCLVSYLLIHRQFHRKKKENKKQKTKNKNKQTKDNYQK